MSTVNGSPTAGGSAREIRGRVRRADGGGVDRAVLTVIDPQGHQVGVGYSDPDGRFGLAVPTSGTYVLIASSGMRQPEALTVSVGADPVDVEIELGGTAGVTGTVHAEGDGGPVAGATVTLTDGRGEVVRSTRTGGDGGFELTDLAAGGYTLVVAHAGRRPAARQIQVPDAGVLACELTLETVTGLAVMVRAASGSAPVAGARITLLDEAGAVVGVGETDGAGRHEFVGLHSGAHTVIADGDAPVSTTLRVVGGSYGHHDVQLGAATGDEVQR